MMILLWLKDQGSSDLIAHGLRLKVGTSTDKGKYL